MSKYTSQLRWIVEKLGEGIDVPVGQDYANAVYKYIGLDKYPIFDETYRTYLNDKIINHFYFREIGFETAAQFAWYLRRTMNEIMPKYNQLYEFRSQGIEHPLADYTRFRNYKDDYTSNIDVESENKNQGKNHTDTVNADRNVFQDTPMSMLSNSGSPSVENLDYATNVTYDDGKATTDANSENKSNGTTDTDRVDARTIVEDVYGRNKSYAAIVKEYYDNYIDIDLAVIKELETLFMGLW